MKRQTFDVKDKKLTVALTRDEHAYIKVQAAERRMTLSAFLINAIQEYINKNQ